MTGMIIFATLATTLLLGVPIAISLGLSGALGMVLIYGSTTAGTIAVAQTTYSSLQNFLLAAIPLYMLMAQFMIRSGLARDMFDLGERLVGRLPGGLVIATIVSCGVFAATSGSSAATVSTIGGVALPEMNRRRVPRELGLGAVACAGSLGILIPPSVILILYGVATGESVADLFIAGIGPGILLVVLMSLYVVLRELRKGRRGDSAGEAGGAAGDADPGTSVPSGGGVVAKPRERVATSDVADRPRLSWGLIPSLSIVPVILLLIYLGLATPTEAAGVGVVYALLIGLFRGKLTLRNCADAVKEAVSGGAMVLAIIAGASVFAKAISLAQVPQDIAAFLTDMDLSATMFVVLTMILFLILGTFLDASSVVLIVVPILLPVLTVLDINLIWFGVLLVINMEIGAVTPPLGVNLFIVRAIAPEVSLPRLLRAVAPFVVVELVGLVLIAVVPDIALFLL